jgi:hypothetical protein
MKMNTFRTLKRQNNLIVFAAGLLTFLLTTTSLNNFEAVYAQQQNTTKSGTFNYTQTDASGNPDWINTGNWSLTGLESSSPTFEAVIDMVKPNGSAAHEHEVSDLAVSGQPSNQTGSTVIEGTTTITMREGPVTDEPTTITLSEKDISVYFDPAKIDDHFGNQSITGSVT